MTLRLHYVRETNDAILYHMKSGETVWIPKSVIRSKLKWPSGDQEVVVEDWWFDKWQESEED